MQAYKVSGLDFFKLLGAIAMCLAHSGMFLSRGIGYAQPRPTSHWGFDFYLLIGFFSLSIPALAGGALRSLMNKYYVDGKILNYDFREILKIAFSLMLLESVKNAIAYDRLMFFSWDVLHFISLSFLLTIFILIRWGAAALYAFCAFSLIVGAVVPAWLSSPSGAATLDYLVFLSRASLRLLILVVPCGLFCWWGRRLLQKATTVSFLKIALTYLICLVLGFSVTTLTWYWLGDLVFFRKISELMPLAMFFKLPPTFGHLWPLFPWFTLVGGGFLLNDIYVRAQNKTRTLWIIFALSFTVFFLFFMFGFEHYRTLMVDRHYFSNKVFSASPVVIVGILGFYATLFAVWTLLFNAIRFHSKIIYNISRGLLLFYFIHFILAFFLYHAFGDNLGKESAVFFFPWVIMLLSYGILSLLLRVVDRPLLINFRRRT